MKCHCLVCQDIIDGDVVEELARSHRHAEDPRHLIMALYYDPYAKARDNKQQSMAPFIVLIVNLPPRLRHKLGVGTHLTCIQSIVDHRAYNTDHAMGLVTDEFDQLDRCACVRPVHTSSSSYSDCNARFAAPRLALHTHPPCSVLDQRAAIMSG
jgi:hypothetical protein